MKSVLRVGVALLVMSALVAANLWRNLQAERLVNADLGTQLAAARSAPPAPAPGAASVVASAPAAAPAPEPAQPDHVLSTQAVSAAITASALVASGGGSEHDLLQDPEYRSAQLTVGRIKLANGNPGLAEALGLSAAEARHLFEVMAEPQLKMSPVLSTAIEISGGAGSGFAGMLQLAPGVDVPVRAELGEARYAQYQDYMRNIRPALTQAASLGSRLAAAGQSMTVAQSRDLTSVLLAEQQRQRQEAALPRANPGAPIQFADAMEQTNARQEEANRRILEASVSNLTPAQRDVLRQQFEQEAASRRRTLDTARQIDARRQQAPTPQGTNP